MRPSAMRIRLGACLLGLGGLSLVAGCGTESPAMSETSHVQASAGGDSAGWVPPAPAPEFRQLSPAQVALAERIRTDQMRDIQLEQARLASQLAAMQQCIRTQQVVPTWHC